MQSWNQLNTVTSCTSGRAVTKGTIDRDCHIILHFMCRQHTVVCFTDNQNGKLAGGGGRGTCHLQQRLTTNSPGTWCDENQQSREHFSYKIPNDFLVLWHRMLLLACTKAKIERTKKAFKWHWNSNENNDGGHRLHESLITICIIQMTVEHEI